MRREELSPPPSDRQLIDQFLAGEAAALHTVDGWIDVGLHEDFRSLRQDWEDLKQEIRSRILRNLGHGAFNGHSSLRTYVHRIARNTAIDFSRLAYRHREVGVELPEPKLSGAALQASRLGILPMKEILERILAELSEGDRLLLHMVFELNYSYEEVARELGIPEGTVKSRMSRCKDRVLRLRQELGVPK
jgi:RNA polymerase sigma-70 factor (ECF subfamily)